MIDILIVPLTFAFIDLIFIPKRVPHSFHCREGELSFAMGRSHQMDGKS
jgi:ADP-ribosylation factor-like protein 2